VKRNTTNGPIDSFPRRSGDRVSMHNSQIYTLIYYAYHLHGAYEMVGFKDFEDPWRWYDVDARIGHDATDDEVRLMMQSMLEDRFHLKVHRETREITEFQLALGKGKPMLQVPVEGPTMKITIEGKQLGTREGTCMGTGWNDGTHITCHAAGVRELIQNLSNELKAPVADQTGLTGKYDLDMHFMPASRSMDSDAEPGPTVQQAVQEQLGLKLEKGKGPIEVLVIDRLEKPSENQ
jgi:uncharacterized protein (TIGR03435 family)